MRRSFTINLNTLSIPRPEHSEQIPLEGLSGLRILCLLLSELGYRVTGTYSLVEVNELYVDELRALITPITLGIPTTAGVDVILIGDLRYLIQFTY